MKSLLLGIVLIVVLGFGGLVYRNAVEHPSRPVTCPMDAVLCPDGTAVARTGSSCTFPSCPSPNVSLPAVGVAYAVPADFVSTMLPDMASIAAYGLATTTPTSFARIIIRRFTILASSTALATIQQTAIGGASGAPVSVTSFTSTALGAHRFTVVAMERFEGVINTAYYLARRADVLRFDAVDTSADWMNPNLDLSALPAHVALRKLLTTLQGE